MELEYEQKYHHLETHHWWFKGRRDILLRLLEQTDKESKILEIGCSGGQLLRGLYQKGFGNVTGIDVSKQAITRCKKEGFTKVKQMDGTKTTFKDNRFDVVVASDVLEHIKEDKKALQEWNRVLKPGGTLLVFVPAYTLLWSSHDEANKHYGRYNKQQLTTLIQQTQYTVQRSSYWNFTLFLPTLLIRLFQRILSTKKKTTDNLHKTPAILNTLLYILLKLENSLLKTINYPFGVSVFVIAKK